MAWSTDLQQASFRNIEFECIQTSESVSKALAIQQSPYSNKAQIEDMGKDAEKISLRIFLSGENYLLYLNALIAAFTLTGQGELIHPIHGIKNVYVASWNIVHGTEIVDGCDLDVEFVEAEAKERPLFVPAFDIEIDTQTFFYIPASALESELEQLKDKDPNAFFKAVNRIRSGLQKARQFWVSSVLL
ncbi:DNA circularization N-terminal domain-containing protein [Acinetobacter sp. CFCC 10889]|uniref:DNA circularization N-terminal domain-containing protein n=1 Tax=Acinetobacter sp. CFCC 10889 TaxID=1775557 RepID=UPI001D18D8FF|nr:DNA circularization N-terminal domain-containing protein [Acinetobacter sp. CFCC 10889]